MTPCGRRGIVASTSSLSWHPRRWRAARGRPPVLRTPFGAVVAEKVVLATNAWLCALPEIRRAVLPMTSDMIATAPIPERLAEIGWIGDECVADGHMMVHYYRTTADGRVAFGKGGCSHAYLGRITQSFEDPGPRIARTEHCFRRIYPALNDVTITHTWTGPIDRSEADLNAGRTSAPVVELLNGFVPSGLRDASPDPASRQ